MKSREMLKFISVTLPFSQKLREYISGLMICGLITKLTERFQGLGIGG